MAVEQLAAIAAAPEKMLSLLQGPQLGARVPTVAALPEATADSLPAMLPTARIPAATPISMLQKEHQENLIRSPVCVRAGDSLALPLTLRDLMTVEFVRKEEPHRYTGPLGSHVDAVWLAPHAPLHCVVVFLPVPHALARAAT